MTNTELIAEHQVELGVIATEHGMQAAIDAANRLIAEYGNPKDGPPAQPVNPPDQPAPPRPGVPSEEPMAPTPAPPAPEPPERPAPPTYLSRPGSPFA
jgi:hypothetical protein